MLLGHATQGMIGACVVVMITATGFAQDSVTAQPSPAVLSIGQILTAEEFHMVSRPGRYGLGPALPGSIYAVVQGRLVRIDQQTYQIKSIIRSVDEILD